MWKISWIYCRVINNEVFERMLKRKLLWKNIVNKWKWMDKPYTLSKMTIRTNIIERSVEEKKSYRIRSKME